MKSTFTVRLGSLAGSRRWRQAMAALDSAQPEAHAQCLDVREVNLPPSIVFGKLMPLGIDHARRSTYR